MKELVPFAISIGRMLGSGGIYIGKRLAERLNIYYFDSDILVKAGKELGISKEDLKDYDEKPISIWDLFLKSGLLENPEIPSSPSINMLTARHLFETEARIIKNTAKERSLVVIGRGGSYTLRDHSQHISVFLYSDIECRKKRVQELYNVTEKDAAKMIKVSDMNRSHYHHTFCGNQWNDARQYTICIDTGKVGFDESVEIILSLAEQNFRKQNDNF